MARRNTLTWTALTGTGILWAATVAAAVTEIGSDRLFLTLRAAALLTAVATVALLALVHLKAQVDDLRGDLNNAVLQAADELHNEATHDRARIVAARALTAELVNARKHRQEHDQAV